MPTPVCVPCSVHVRVRPLNDLEKDKGRAWRVESNSIYQTEPGTDTKVSDNPYKLDTVFDGTQATAEVYSRTTQHLIQQVVEGFNSTVFVSLQGGGVCRGAWEVSRSCKWNVLGCTTTLAALVSSGSAYNDGQSGNECSVQSQPSAKNAWIKGLVTISRAARRSALGSPAVLFPTYTWSSLSWHQAYGQTSSGKTHTMRGTAAEPGIIPLAVGEIFALIERAQDREFLIRVSYMEVRQRGAAYAYILAWHTSAGGRWWQRAQLLRICSTDVARPEGSKASGGPGEGLGPAA